MDAHVNTADEPFVSDKNLTNFGPDVFVPGGLHTGLGHACLLCTSNGSRQWLLNCHVLIGCVCR